MTITISGTPEEIAALVLAVQERRTADAVIEEINRRTSEMGRSLILT